MPESEPRRTILACSLLTGVALWGFPGCERPGKDLASCPTAVAAHYQAGFVITPPDATMLSESAAQDFCEQTRIEAEATGCATQHQRWRDCLHAAEAPCDRALWASLACSAGDPYEFHCSDWLDNDQDNALDCADPDCANAPDCVPTGQPLPQGLAPAVDLVVVLDFTAGAAPARAQLQDQFDSLIAELRQNPGELPDLHVGFVSADLGAGGHSIPGCADPAPGAAGRMLPGSCTGLDGPSFFVDTAPRGCEMTRLPYGGCTEHDCVPSHCDHEPTAILVLDEYGCPRCRNYGGVLPDQLTTCLANEPVSTCPFQQPLEALRLALNDHPENPGFLRPDALTGVVVMSAADDCSAADPGLFDPAASELGPATAFRCFEYGVACDQDGRDPGIRTGCAPAPAGGPVAPITAYADFLAGLKTPLFLTVAAIGGPVDPAGVSVTLDATGDATLEGVCSAGEPDAVPGIRLRELSNLFNDLDQAFWPYSTVCGELSAALMGFGERLAAGLAPPCAADRLAGCTDPGAEHGEPADGEPCNDLCQPRCRVLEITDHGLPSAAPASVPACLQVCPEGLCPHNVEPGQAYAGGQPPAIDPDLPVPACWQVSYHPGCTASGGALITLSHRQAALPRTVAWAECEHAPALETACDDGLDNDGDCRVDLEDPDCGA